MADPNHSLADEKREYALVALPSELAAAGHFRRLAEILTSFDFALKRCTHRIFGPLLDDYQLSSSDWSEDERQAVAVWRDFFREHIHLLRRGSTEWPAQRIMLQLAIEHGDTSPVSVAAEEWLKKGRCRWSWLRAKNRPSDIERSYCTAVFEGHEGPIQGAGRLPNDLVVSVSTDGTLRFWERRSAACMDAREHLTPEVRQQIATWNAEAPEHPLRLDDNAIGPLLVCDNVVISTSRLGVEGNEVDLFVGWSVESRASSWAVFREEDTAVIGRLPGERIVRFGRDDSTAYIHDARTGNELEQTTSPHGHWIDSAAYAPDGRVATWSTLDDKGTIQIWDFAKRTQVLLTGHRATVEEVIFLSDGRLVSCSIDGTIRFWGGRVSSMKTDYNSGLLECGIRKLVGWGLEHDLCLWDLDTRRKIGVLEGHEDVIKGTLRLRDDDWFLSWSDDHTLRVWDIKDLSCVAVLRGHKASVCGALVFDDGEILSWSDDGSLRTWRVDSRRSLPDERPIHKGAIRVVGPLPSGLIASLGEQDTTAAVWDPGRGKCLRRVRLLDAPEAEISLLSDGTVVSSEGSDEDENVAVRRWDLVQGQCIDEWQGKYDAEMPSWAMGPAYLGPKMLSNGELEAEAASAEVRVISRGDKTPIARWHSDVNLSVHHVFADGTVMVTTSGGKVIFLQLWHGPALKVSESISTRTVEAATAPPLDDVGNEAERFFFKDRAFVARASLMSALIVTAIGSGMLTLGWSRYVASALILLGVWNLFLSIRDFLLPRLVIKPELFRTVNVVGIPRSFRWTEIVSVELQSKLGRIGKSVFRAADLDLLRSIRRRTDDPLPLEATIVARTAKNRARIKLSRLSGRHRVLRAFETRVGDRCSWLSSAPTPSRKTPVRTAGT